MSAARNDDDSHGPGRPDTLRPSRRQLLLGASGAALALHSGAASAQSGNWFDTIFNQGSGGARAATSEDGRRKPEVLNDLRPDSTPWRSDTMLDAIEGAIKRYQKIADAGGWPVVPGSRMIRPEDDDERIPLVRRRLATSGELPRNGLSQSFTFDGELELAVRRFQESQGLRISGRVDKPTLAALNVPVQTRLAQLRLNAGRIRELMGPRVEDRYILVNVPAFQLEAVERHDVQQRHRVIAGRPERQSPYVRANIRAVNFFPYWRVPDSVATLDIIPRMRKEPDYIIKERIRVVRGNFNGPEIDPTAIDWNTATSVDLKFRQDPGPHNALGLMRIDMPNSEGVYMHDTPMKQLFTQRTRAFSAGCVRVQDVDKLVEWIARYEAGWEQPGRAMSVVEGGQALDLTLTRQVPVYFAYITAWAEPSDGRAVFRPDIYGRDGLKESTAGRERDESEGPAPAHTLAP
jgi:murein L,D-transpeptidase YcbB/YkuD